jgi:hypothetical protein
VLALLERRTKRRQREVDVVENLKEIEEEDGMK